MGHPRWASNSFLPAVVQFAACLPFGVEELVLPEKLIVCLVRVRGWSLVSDFDFVILTLNKTFKLAEPDEESRDKLPHRASENIRECIRVLLKLT